MHQDSAKDPLHGITLEKILTVLVEEYSWRGLAEQVQEFVTHSWYTYGDETKGLHPWDGVTEPNYELGARTKGTRTKIEQMYVELVKRS